MKPSHAAIVNYLTALWNRDEAFEYLASECELTDEQAEDIIDSLERGLGISIKMKLADHNIIPPPTIIKSKRKRVRT